MSSKAFSFKALSALMAWALCGFANGDVAQLIQQGDALDARLDNEQALEAYLRAEKLGGNDADTLYRRTKVEYSRLIKEHAETALQLDPSDSYAWHVLGAWNYELAQMSAVTRVVVKVVYGGIPAASNEEAARLFHKAVELAPQRVSHHVELGRAYLALGRQDQARVELQKALALPNQEKDDPESKRRGTEALARL